MTPVRKVTFAIAAAILLLCGGIWLGGHPETLPDPVRDAFVDDDRALRAEVVDSIKDSFYRPVKDSDIDENSLKGIVQGLGDQFSNYLTPAETKEFEESVQGEFEGVGMNVDEDRRGLQVINVFDGSPAKKGGIKKGDFITEVNGRSTRRCAWRSWTPTLPRRARSRSSASASRCRWPRAGSWRSTASATAWWSSPPSATARTGGCARRSTR